MLEYVFWWPLFSCGYWDPSRSTISSSSFSVASSTIYWCLSSSSEKRFLPAASVAYWCGGVISVSK
jgi:hypothetical protein